MSQSMAEIGNSGGEIQTRVNQEILGGACTDRVERTRLRDGSKSRSREPKLDSRVKIIDIRNTNQGYGQTGWTGKKLS
jgi:hypothetical protein